ncbi:MAG: hydroxymethylbilane synthase [Candidatus Anammoxibacter sp.]
MSKQKIIIGSRGSKLAMIQANWAKDTLGANYPDIEFVIKEISTKGDRITDVPLSRLGGVGLFTKELENSLLNMEIDIAVHSAKDMPAELPDGLSIAAFPKREDPHDVLISKDNLPVDKLPVNAVIGTSSLRRRAQLLAGLPGIRINDLRGNVDTRIKKLETENLDGIILASAGLNRMGYDEIKRQIIPFDYMLPAVGQGSLGIEIRTDDKKTFSIVSTLNDDDTNSAVTAERSLLGKLHGGCQTPVGAIGEITSNKQLKLTALVSSLDGTNVIKDNITGDIKNATDIGLELAGRLLSHGADKILEEIRASLKNGI